MIKYYNREEIEKRTSIRYGEKKVGQVITLIQNIAELNEVESPYVLLGLPEDIGVEGNMGRKGTAEAWDAFLDNFLNLQVNDHVNIDNAAILGAVDFSAIYAQLDTDVETGPFFRRMLTLQIDELVAPIVQKIIAAGKTPIIIGGGHNNSYPNLKGASKALGKSVDCLNVDAHTDFRNKEGRHSGNGFSYANHEGYLDNYLVYGLQKAYTPQSIFDQLDTDDSLNYIFYEDIVSEDEDFLEDVSSILDDKIAVEIDCDVIANFPSSAMSPIGFSIDEIQQLLDYIKHEHQAIYYHFCEAAPSLADNGKRIVGRTLSWWVFQIIE